jgi:hypothetical protein
MATDTTQELHMADPPRARDPGDAAAGVAADHKSPPGMPRWVKVSGIIVAVLVLLLVIVLLLSGGHGPRRHLSHGTAGHAPRSSVTASLTLSGGGPGGLHAVWG